jgi:hypothetical protein
MPKQFDNFYLGNCRLRSYDYQRRLPWGERYRHERAAVAFARHPLPVLPLSRSLSPLGKTVTIFVWMISPVTQQGL